MGDCFLSSSSSSSNPPPSSPLSNDDNNDIDDNIPLPPGILNMGNTCYLAAAVQMMGSLPSFLDDLALSIEEGAAGVAEGGLCL